MKIKRSLIIIASFLLTLSMLTTQFVIASGQELIPRRGGTITVAIQHDLQNFDPTLSTPQEFRAIFRKAVFNMLLEYDETGTLRPALATSWENPDPKTYIFHLRKGVRWHDGKLFTSKDVKYTFDRVRNPKIGSYLFPYFENVASVDTIDDFTIRIKMSKVFSSFLDGIALTSIIPDGSGDTMISHPVGTGPFKFVKWIPNDRIILKRNENYWESGLPYVDQLILKVQPEPQVSITYLQAGTVDAIIGLPGSLVPVAKALPNVDLLIQDPSTVLYFIELQADRTYTKTAKLRQALAMTFDYDAIRKVIFNGYGTPSSNFLHPKSPYWLDLPLYKYDPEKAKTIFVEEGITKDTPPLIIEAPAGYSDLVQLAVIWQSGLAKAGIRAEIRVSEFQVWLNRTLGNDYEVTTNLYGPSFDPDTWFDVITVRHWYHGVGKEGDYVTPRARELEDVCKRALNTGDEHKKVELWHQAQKIHYEELPGAIPVFLGPIFMPVAKSIHNCAINPLGEYFFKKAWREK